MKVQNGFISSSSSTTIEYSTHTVTNKKFVGMSEGYEKVLSKTSTSWVGSTYNTYSNLQNTTYDQTVTWSTYKGTSYQRIEYFMEAVEKLNSAYSSNEITLYPMYNYSQNVAAKKLYDGFVDIVITFPCEIRLAGIELLNPWNNKLSNDAEYNYWKYLPKEFYIFKVNTEKLNENLDNISYEKDVMRITRRTSGEQSIRPVFFEKVERDENLTFLGHYNVKWDSLSSYKCFFKYNFNDAASLASEANGADTMGTATWKCKQLVIRIIKGYEKNDYSREGILENISKYILDKELSYGSTGKYGDTLTLDKIEKFYEQYVQLPEISATITSGYVDPNGLIDFKGSESRSYWHINEAKFTARNRVQAWWHTASAVTGHILGA